MKENPRNLQPYFKQKYFVCLRGESSERQDFLPRRQWFRALPRRSLLHVVDKVQPAVQIHALLPPAHNNRKNHSEFSRHPATTAADSRRRSRCRHSETIKQLRGRFKGLQSEWNQRERKQEVTTSQWSLFRLFRHTCVVFYRQKGNTSHFSC